MERRSISTVIVYIYFELIKPELRQFSPAILASVKRSFYHPQHWLTMLREMINLDLSGEQLKQADNLNNLPIIIIKSQNFFKRSILNFFLPLKQVDSLRDRINERLLQLSKNTTLIKADNSSHFVWIDRPDSIVLAVRKLFS